MNRLPSITNKRAPTRVGNRSATKEIARRLGNGKPPIHDMPTPERLERGYRPHYHPHGRTPSTHIFYSVAAGLTLSHWAQGHGRILEWGAWVGDLVQPFSMVQDLADFVDLFRSEDSGNACKGSQ
jgi:hypothetical protein